MYIEHFFCWSEANRMFCNAYFQVKMFKYLNVKMKTFVFRTTLIRLSLICHLYSRGEYIYNISHAYCIYSIFNWFVFSPLQKLLYYFVLCLYLWHWSCFFMISRKQMKVSFRLQNQQGIHWIGNSRNHNTFIEA